MKNLSLTLTKGGNEMLAIRMLNEDAPSWVLSVFDKNERSLYSTVLKANSSISVEDMKDTFLAGEFDGSLTFGTTENAFSFDFEKSVLSTSKPSDNGKISQCRDTRDAYNCAGSDLEDMGPASLVLCIIEFPICMAALIFDCWYRGCDRPEAT